MKYYTKPLENCPSCDSRFRQKVWLGEDWECPACGEYGTHKAGGYSDVPLTPIFPEFHKLGELYNVA